MDYGDAQYLSFGTSTTLTSSTKRVVALSSSSGTAKVILPSTSGLAVGGPILFLICLSATSMQIRTPGDTATVLTLTQNQVAVMSLAGTAATPEIKTGFVLGSLGPLRNNYGSGVGSRFTIGSQNISVTSLARYVVPGNTQNHSLVIYDISSNILASVSLATSGKPEGLSYVNLSSPLTLIAGNNYYLFSNEIDGGDQWHDIGATTPANSTDITANYLAFNRGGAPYYYDSTQPNTGYVGLNFKYSVAGSNTSSWRGFKRTLFAGTTQYHDTSSYTSPCVTGGEPTVPPTDPTAYGAICYPNGQCVMGTSAQATATGGTFAGTGTDCAQTNRCPTGSICLPSGECVIGTAALAAILGGTYRGNGTTCAVSCFTDPGGGGGSGSGSGSGGSGSGGSGSGGSGVGSGGSGLGSGGSGLGSDGSGILIGSGLGSGGGEIIGSG